MNTIANAKITHNYNCYKGIFFRILTFFDAYVCSLLATCKAHEVNPRDYLNDVIARMPYMQKASYDELLQLLPHR